MPRRRRNKVLTSLEGLFEAGSRHLQKSIETAVSERTASLEAEIKELRKTINRLHQTLAQGGGGEGGRRRGPIKLCLVEGCGRKHAAKGLCKNHYQQWLNRKKKDGANAPKPGGVPRNVGGTKPRRTKRRKSRR